MNNNLLSCLRTAEGYITLGLHQEAWDALDEIEPPQLRAETAVLKLRLVIQRAIGRPEDAELLATALRNRGVPVP